MRGLSARGGATARRWDVPTSRVTRSSVQDGAADRPQQEFLKALSKVLLAAFASFHIGGCPSRWKRGAACFAGLYFISMDLYVCVRAAQPRGGWTSLINQLKRNAAVSCLAYLHFPVVSSADIFRCGLR